MHIIHIVKTIKPCDKLDYQCHALFVILNQINDIKFHLDLHPHIPLDKTVNVRLLEPYASRSFLHRALQRPTLCQLVDGPKFRLQI